jgi:hypothetical protein
MAMTNLVFVVSGEAGIQRVRQREGQEPNAHILVQITLGATDL